MKTLARWAYILLWAGLWFGLTAFGGLYLFCPELRHPASDFGADQVRDRDGATKEQFDRVQIGMSEEEVKAILGPPTEVAVANAIGTGGVHLPDSKLYVDPGTNGATIEVSFILHEAQAKQWIGLGARKPDK
jgi:hypothetical protein